MSVVVDTNVPIVANGGHNLASEDCILACINALQSAASDVVIIDDEFRVFEEYKRYLSHAGQPGVGDAFFKLLWSNQANPERCRQVTLTPIDDEIRLFEEFPSDADLIAFDRSDKKFVAVAIASGENPAILNAVDNDWWEFRIPLARYVTLDFLCPQMMGR